jgi:hypothetical protein
MKKSRNGLVKNLHYLCLVGVIALGLMTIVGTGGGGGGGDGPVVPTVCDDASGTWTTTEVIDLSGCGWPDETELGDYTVTQTDCSITVTDNNKAQSYTGTINGNRINWTGSWPEDEGGTTTASISLTLTGNDLSGSATWTWREGVDSCSGTTQITGTRTGGPPPGGNGTLNLFEQALVGKWYRWHGYDDTDEYYIFKGDRTACYFEYQDSSRTKNTNYIYWQIDENNPVGPNVFAVEVQYSGGSWKSTDRFHYTTDELWRGGYSNLDMHPSQTSRDCQ